MSSLTEYRRKRKFGQTPEPEPGPKPSAPSNRFVVQKHDATRLHYDFRLEIDGALKSWAIPKGPSLNPADKRLAMETEDHPLEYADFEGVIPEGHYGAGPVIIWDRGTFTLEGDASASEQYRRGELKFALHGERLRGSFVLVKLRQADGKGKPWLLIKHKDAAADPNWNIEALPASVTTGRDLKEVEEGLPASASVLQADPGELEGAEKARMPEAIQPMLATLAEKPFSRPDWLFEIKWDGVRALAWIKEGKLELRSRTGRTITAQYPDLAGLPGRVHAGTAILDGEIVALDPSGRSSFELLQSRMNVRSPSESQQRQAPATYFIFDLLYCDGYDLRGSPLLQRKNLLRRVLEPGGPFSYADHLLEKGKELFEVAKEQGLEGIIGKRQGSRYSETRSLDWMKFKITKTVDAVVGGYTEPRGSREHFGALLVGFYEGKTLRFVGGVGTGFDLQKQTELFDKLKPLETAKCPFTPVPKTQEKANWVEPALVARVKYANWTNDGRLRAPVFLTLLEDHNPADCQFQTETPTSSAAEKPESGDGHKPAGNTRAAAGGRILASDAEIDEELFKGRAENVSVEIEGQLLRLTNLNKVYFPESGYTKRDLLAYYYRIAPYILPFLKDRPLVLRRYPDGITGESFFQKDAGLYAADWMETVAIPSEEKGADIRYFIANDRAALLYLTNLGCIDQNAWSSRRDDLEHPDYVFFDLDPSDGTDFTVVIEVARAVHAKLLELQLKAFLKTSGATGFHIYIPLEREYTFEQVRTFADIVGRLVAAEMPKQVTQQRIVAKRPAGTVLIDAYQNASGRPLALPYAARAFPKAPVSAPVAPRELRHSLRPDRLNIKSIFPRLEESGDLWRDFWDSRQTLEDAIQRIRIR